MPQTPSPFRYPGGKSQLYPFVSNLLKLNHIDGTYIETFAGGSAIGLKLLFSNQINHIVINDYDTSIYSVWHAILNHPEYLINKINEVPFDYYYAGNPEANIKFWKKQRSIYFEEKYNPRSLPGAFATLFLNRTNRSGIITGGPLGGWSQKNTQIGARFTKSTLIQKILAIHERRDDITVSNLDALKMIPSIPSIYDADNTFIFFDPPYFDQGGSLYYSSLEKTDHERLAKQILSLHDYRWIVTYDYQPIIQTLYQDAPGKYEYKLNYSANNRGKAPEYLFRSELTQAESFSKTVLNPI